METWREIPGYATYEASDCGRIRRMSRAYKDFKKNYPKPPVILKSSNNGGYRQVVLYRDGPNTIKVHRLIAITFIPNPSSKETVNHLNGVKNDNRIKNLEWATRSENTKHKYIIGLQSNKGEKHPMAKLNPNDIKVIRRTGKTVEARKRLSQIYGVCSEHIQSIVARRTWKHI